MAWSQVIVMISAAVRMLAALILLTAAMPKLRRRDAFSSVLHNYRLLPERIVPAVAIILPIAEIVTAGLLISWLSSWAPLIAAALLFLVFAFAMDINIRRGRAHIDCGCRGGELSQPLKLRYVVRNVMLASMLVAVAFCAGPRANEVSIIFLGAGAGVISFVLYSALELVWGLQDSAATGRV